MAAEGWRYVLTVDGREVEFGDGEVTLGRSRTSTIRIEHESVSRSHALLTFERGNGILKDLNSSNGTYVGGRRILNETRLSDGDRIQLGAANIGYRVVPPAESPDRTSKVSSAARPPLPEAPSVPEPVAPAAPPPPAPLPAGEEEAEPVPFRPAPLPPVDPLSAEERAEPAPVPPLSLTVDEVFAAVDRRAEEEASGFGPAVPPAPAPLRRDAFPAPPDAAPPFEVELPPPVAPVGAAALPPRREPRPLADATLSHVLLDPSERIEVGAEVRGPEPASAVSRLAAVLVDSVILLALDLLLLSPVFLILFFRGELQPSEGGPDWALNVIGSLCGTLILGANLWYTVGAWARSGRTPGKALVGICVVNVGEQPGTGLGFGVAVRRALCLLLSLLPCGLGLVTALFRRDRRAWHDLLVGTQVVRSR